MISLRISGVRTDIHFTFLLFNAMLFLLRENQTILCFYGGCILHELGHIFAAAAAGISVQKVSLTGTGIIMTAEKNSSVPMKYSLMVLLSGPAVNLFCAGIINLVGGSDSFAAVNFALCVYNLLPFSLLDGGTLLETLVAGRTHEYVLRRGIAVLKFAAVGAMIILLLYELRVKMGHCWCL